MVKARIQKMYQSWLRRRIPPQRDVTLDQRRVFIFPTSYGFFFVLVCFLLFIGGINYENNLLLALSFLLTSLFITTILHTFRNLAGLTLQAGDSRSGFAGKQGALEIVLRSHRQSHRSLWLRWPEGASREVSLETEDEARLWLDCPLNKRGKVYPGRLRIETRYPLGLLRSWSLIDLDMYCLAWPKPIASAQPPASGGDDLQHEQETLRTGTEDFDGLRSYQEGDSLRLIDWKSFARGKGLNTKVFTDPAEGRLWLEWDKLSGSDIETRLGNLSYWVLQFDQQQALFGMRLPGSELSPDSGSLQRQKALDALALYGEEG